MKRTSNITFLLSSLAMASVALGACEKKDPTPSKDTEVVKESAEVAIEKPELPSKPAQPTHTHSHSGEGTPTDLKTIMIGLGTDMASVQSGLWIDDFERIAENAMKVANHPEVTSDEKARIMETLGNDFGAFVAMDKAAHHGALKLAEAAETKNATNTLEALASLQTNCVSCHSQFRSKLVR